MTRQRLSRRSIIATGRLRSNTAARCSVTEQQGNTIHENAGAIFETGNAISSKTIARRRAAEATESRVNAVDEAEFISARPEVQGDRIGAIERGVGDTAQVDDSRSLRRSGGEDRSCTSSGEEKFIQHAHILRLDFSEGSRN